MIRHKTQHHTAGIALYAAIDRPLKYNTKAQIKSVNAKAVLKLPGKSWAGIRARRLAQRSIPQAVHFSGKTAGRRKVKIKFFSINAINIPAITKSTNAASHMPGTNIGTAAKKQYPPEAFHITPRGDVSTV